MTEKKKIGVQVAGRKYFLISCDEEKYVHSVADEVEKHIDRTLTSRKQIDIRDCAVLAALDFCDDRNKALQKNKDYVAKADKIIRQTGELNRLCTEYKEKLAEAINENTALVKRIKSLEKELEALARENNVLKAAVNTDSDGGKNAQGSEKKPADDKKYSRPAGQYSLFREENGKKN